MIRGRLNGDWTLPIVHVGFVLIGVVNTLLGPILPLLSVKWQLDDAQAGRLFIGQFAGAIAGAAASSRLIGYWGFRRVLWIGFGEMAAAVALLAVSRWVIGILCVLGYGVGLGVAIPAANLWISELRSENRASALNILNLMWCLGAVASPGFISWLAMGSDPERPLLGLASLLAVMAVLLARRRPLVVASRRGLAESQEPSTARLWFSPYMMLTGATFLVYTGTETASGGWIASYAHRLNSAPGSFWAMSQSFFWAGLLAGRAGAPVALRRLHNETLVLTGSIIALLGLALIVADGHWLNVLAGTGLAGLGLAPIFPTAFAIFAERVGSRASELAGGIFMLASLGGALMPWTVGWVSDQYGDLRRGLLVPLVGAGTLILLQVWMLCLQKPRIGHERARSPEERKDSQDEQHSSNTARPARPVM